VRPAAEAKARSRAEGTVTVAGYNLQPRSEVWHRHEIEFAISVKISGGERTERAQVTGRHESIIPAAEQKLRTCDAV
jgi:hypothetical protein